MVSVKKDDYARVLDYLPKGKSEVPPHKRKPLVQAIGTKYFSLLEISPQEGMTFELDESIYIGDETRDKVDHIDRRIKYEWLTPTAKSELPHVLKEIIEGDEKDYVTFYNTAGTITTRQHKFETLPKIGKRHRDEIIQERERMPFASFQDMRERLKSSPDPAKVIVDKIVEELRGESKYYFFVDEYHGARHDD